MSGGNTHGNAKIKIDLERWKEKVKNNYIG